MPIKHSKYKNTGILFELLVRQTTADLLENKDSKAVKIIKKYFTQSTELGKEYALYNMCVASKKLTEAKAEMLISTIVEEHKKLNKQELDRQKYNLIKEIKKSYDLEEFFKAKVNNYKQYASVYTILESNYSKQYDPKQVLANKLNLLEHITQESISEKPVPQQLIEDLMKEDKEIRILSYKIMVEKFNDRYKNMNEHQKSVLKEYISSIADSVKLKKFLNDKMKDVKEKLDDLREKIEDPVIKIKLTEVTKLVKPLKDTLSIKDEVITGILQCYDLIEELKKSSNV